MTTITLSPAKQLASAMGAPGEKSLLHFSLEAPDKVRTCGDIVYARLHVKPGEKPLKTKYLRVSLKGKITHAIRTEKAGHDNYHYGKVYLFAVSTTLLDSETIVSTPRAWDLAFEFPWHACPHPSQEDYARSHPRFLVQAGPEHRLPPSCNFNYGSPIRIRYYLEAEYTREVGPLTTTESEKCTVHFCPPLENLSPPPGLTTDESQRLVFQSRLWGSKGVDQAQISATAPSACVIGTQIPIDLHLSYDGGATPVKIGLMQIVVRLVDSCSLRIPASVLTLGRDLDQTDEQVLPLLSKTLAVPITIHDGMRLNDVVPILLRRTVGTSYTTFAVRRDFRLEVDVKLQCLGKKRQFNILRHPLIVYPSYEIHRTVPTTIPDPAEHVDAAEVPQGQGKLEEENQFKPPRFSEDTLPPYERDCRGTDESSDPFAGDAEEQDGGSRQ